MTWLIAALGVVVAGPLILIVPDFWLPASGAPLAVPFAYGALAGAVCGIVVQRFVPFLPILEHELTHMLAAICLFRKPLGVRADDEGGDTTYAGRGSTLIRLAPYLIPTVTVLGLAARLVIRVDLFPHLAAVLGVTFGFHLYTGWVEAHPSQPDLKKGGLLPSYVAIATWGVVVHVATALAAVGGWPLVRGWLVAGWHRALTFVP